MLELDYLVYFLTATLQGFKPEIDGLELFMFKKMEGPASIVAYKGPKGLDSLST